MPRLLLAGATASGGGAGRPGPGDGRSPKAVAGPALGFLFILRIVMSWYPRAEAPRHGVPLRACVTRRIIPPLGGVDVTPVVWFGIVSFLNEILVGQQGLLVLLSQQQQL
ncbi:hypothetical protein HU200_048228 [Digitaria exilis]|uniref:Uncharacterized protein n=1 Tax=Digitaria exilis TaxID=1010633 RepID=A0A835AVT9_9POAL|nr:hypothetical protein HU200_048228 [Digitaria exilis]